MRSATTWRGLGGHAALAELVVTDSIAATAAVKAAQKVRRITIAPLLAEAMRRTAEESSVSSLFD